MKIVRVLGCILLSLAVCSMAPGEEKKRGERKDARPDKKKDDKKDDKAKDGKDDKVVDKSGIDLKRLTLGNYVCGPERKMSDLTNRVVAVGFWNINSGPSLGALAALEQWQKEFADGGLICIGIHPFKFSNEAISGTCKDKSITFSVFVEGKMAGETTGAGAILVFDHTGKLVFNGDSVKGQAAVKEFVAKAPANVVGARELVKLKRLSDALKAGTYPPKLLKTIMDSQKAEDKETVDEANYLFERVKKWANDQIEVAKAARVTEALKCKTDLDNLAKDLKGTEFEKLVTDAQAGLEKDAAYQSELAAWLSLEKVKEAEKKLKPMPPKRQERWKKESEPVLKEIKDLVEQMQKDSPKSKATEQAVAIGKKYGLIEDPKPDQKKDDKKKDDQKKDDKKKDEKKKDEKKDK